jgi:hypothetical protein
LHKHGVFICHRKEKKMNMVPSFTTLRSFISYQFSALRMRALRDQLWMKLSGAKSELVLFPGNAPRLRFTANRKLIGIKDIRVAEIVGTLNRDTDFDHQFRPLKKHTLTRWVNAYILHEQDGWPPIIVHKVGEQYFVEDGHHRVSVARSTGMEFMEATVWEYSHHSQYTDKCQPPKCPEKSRAKVYVTGQT